jgi:hypothetical protein
MVAHLDEEMNLMRSRSCPRPKRPQAAAVTPLAVLNLSLLVGVVALVVDGGTLMEARRHVQAGADAAALAGAADLYTNYSTNQGIDLNGTAQASALAIASANGFDNDGVQSTVTVNTSPRPYQGGPNAGQPIPPGYIEVLIQYNATHLFSGVFGAGSTPVPARAVARGQTSLAGNNAVFVLNMSSKVSGALAVTSLASLTVNGGIQINSSSPSALEVNTGASVTAGQLTVNPAVVNLLGSISSLLGLGGSAPVVSSAPPVADPLRFLPAPDPTQLGLSTQGTNLVLASGIMTDLYPGVYNGGIQVQTGATAILHTNSDGSPGIFYLNGSNGLQVSGSASITTATGETGGVMIYNNWSTTHDSISLSGSGAVTILPPAYGPYRGLSIFQERGTLSSHGPTLSISGQGNLNVSGTIYAAYAAVSLGGSGTNVVGGQIIADTLSLSGSAAFQINPGTQPTANQRVFGLVQ